MARASTMNVSLTPALQQYVKSKVAGGGYESASEVIRDSLRALQARERAQQSFWSDVRRKVQIGKRQAAEGRIVDGEAAMEEIIAAAGPSSRRLRGRGARRK